MLGLKLVSLLSPGAGIASPGAEHIMQGPLQKLWIVVCIDLPSSVSTS